MTRTPTPLEAREALLAEAERIVGMGSWVWDIQTGEHEWSDNLFRLLGLEQGAVVPSTELFHSVIHSEDREHVAAEMARAAEREAAPNEPVQYRVIREGGEVRTLLSRVLAVRDDDGQLIRFVGTVTDRTERLAQLAEAKQARDVMAMSQQIARLGSWIWDPITNETASSSESLRILGTGQQDFEDFVGRLHADDMNAVVALREEVFARGAAGPLQVRYTRPDEELRYLELHVRAIGDDPRTSPHVGTVHDVTERVHLEHQLQLSRTLEATGRLAAGVAHDFNNLLMVMMNCALELAEERPDERLDQIVAATESGAEVVRHLLEFGRPVPKEPRVVDLSETIRDMAGWLSRLLGDEVRVELELSEQPVRVRADPAQLHQVLLNLAVNARDAMPGGGVIRLQTSMAEGQAILSVADEGVGMSEEVQRRALDPFFSTKAVGKGSGLGLSMAYGVVTQLGGTLGLSSEVQRGTRVEIRLPLAEAEAQSPAPPPPAPAESRKLTIVLVDDDEAVRSVTRRMLEHQGHTVLVAEGPNEAASCWNDSRPDLVLTDLAMPDGGGERVAELLAAAHPTVPIVFMTGHAPTALPGPAIHKPFRMTALVRVIEEALGEEGGSK